MSNLRRKQVEEVLDEDRRINRRVFDKEKEQAKVFTEATKPKSDRDLSIEVDVDRSVEKFNSLIEKKLIDLDIIFKYAPTDSRYREAQKEILSTGSTIIAYNDLARLAIRPDLSQVTKEAVKTKITQIQNGVDALVYGIGELVKKWSGQGADIADFAKRTYPLLSVYILFKTIQRQLFKGSITPLTTAELENNMREWRASLAGSDRAEVANFLGKISNVERALQLNLRPVVVKAKEDALRRRANILRAEKGAPLSEDELTYLRNSIFGVGESPTIDPALRAELDRQAGIETRAKAEIGSRVVRPEPAVAPLPSAYYNQANPEFIEGVAKGIIDRNRTALRSAESDMDKALAKYAPNRNGTFNDVDLDVVEEDVTELTNALLNARVALAESRGEDADVEALEEEITAKYAVLFDEDPRNTPANARRFYRLIKELEAEILTAQASVIEIEQEAEIKSAKERIRPVGEGSARSKKGKLGIEYDDAKNDPYTRY